MYHHTTQTTQLIEGYTAHQLVRGMALETTRRRRWSLTEFAETGGLVDRTAIDVELFLARFPVLQTRHCVLSDLRQFYRWAMRRAGLTVDPTFDVDPIRVPSREATPLTDAQLWAVFNGTRTHDELVAVLLAAYAGLRVSEIANLHTNDIHRRRPPRPSVIVVRGGKGKKDGIVPLADELDAVLPHTGKAVSYHNAKAASSAIRRVYRRVGIDARPHDLRHTYGTAAAIKAQGNVWIVKSLMRHARLASSEGYVRFNPAGAHIVTGLHVPPPAEAA
jgi:integrase/recombinase XerD